MGWRDMSAAEAEEIGRHVYQEKVRPTLKGAEEPVAISWPLITIAGIGNWTRRCTRRPGVYGSGRVWIQGRLPCCV